MNTLSINGLESMKAAQVNNLNTHSTAIKKYNCEDESCTPSFKGISLTKTRKASRLATLITILGIGLLAFCGCKKQQNHNHNFNEYYIDENDTIGGQMMDSIMHQFDSIQWWPFP